MLVPEVITMSLRDEYDVVVIGGGAAGLNGALMLARARRSVLVIDGGAPRNAPASGVHGLLARDGMSPAELLETGRREVRRYGGQVVTAEVTHAAREDHGFAVTLVDSQTAQASQPLGDGQTAGARRLRGERTVLARRLLVATGLVDELPEVPGLRERWGRDVVHCPYCHGWEIRERAIGVLASGPLSVHQALLFRQWSGDVVYFGHTAAPPDDEQAERLAARGIRVVHGQVAGLEIVDDRLTGVRLHDGTVVPRDAVAVSPHVRARGAVLADLGLRPTPHPLGVGEYIEADPRGATAVPGVWVAGNVTDLMAQVGAAAAGGAIAAAAINADLVEDETRQAVAEHRDRPRAAV